MKTLSILVAMITLTLLVFVMKPELLEPRTAELLSQSVTVKLSRNASITGIELIHRIRKAQFKL